MMPLLHNRYTRFVSLDRCSSSGAFIPCAEEKRFRGAKARSVKAGEYERKSTTDTFLQRPVLEQMPELLVVVSIF